jgi:hypothetical protein
MFAIIAAVMFGIALLFALLNVSFDVINTTTLMLAGLLFVALHLAPISAFRSRRR